MKVFTGIDVGGTNINIGLVSETEQIIAETTIKTEVVKGPENALDRIASALQKLFSDGPDELNNKGVGIGLPGLLDIEKGCIIESSNLPGWQNYPIAHALSKRINKPVFIENDANLAALGEYWLGAGREAQDLFMITLGSGIGGALLTGGKIFRLHPSAGEFGHMIIEKTGETCTCGRKGCLETYVSKHGFQRLTEKMMPAYPSNALRNFEMHNITPQILAMTASKGDQLAIRIFLEAGEALGIAISNVINLTGVTHIIVGGGIANAWDLMREAVMLSLEKNVFQSIFSDVIVKRAVLGEKAGFVGAARLVFTSLPV
ncbi:MAG: ROK family protein [Bacteroidales bacterium]|nr:ROK family protein [Bacteroidales bacterium]MBN2761820.1 ROK family protein [Bacteroidales bacterium]